MATSLRLPADLETRLNALAASTGRSKTYYIVEAIQEHLADLEDVYLAEQRLIELRTGRTTARPLSEVMRAHGVDD